MSIHVSVGFVGRAGPVPDWETARVVDENGHDRVPDENGTRSGTTRTETTE
jgi:hypothetical protein